MQGLYQKKLQRVFTFIMLVTSLLVIGLGFLLFNHLKKNDLQTKRLAAMSQTQYINAGFSSITKALEDLLSSPLLEAWAASKDDPNFYFNSIALWDKLKTVTSPLGTLNYEFSVTSDRLNGLVLTRNGTISRELYYQEETTLETAQQDSINHFAHTRHASPMLLPSYNAKGMLQEIYIVTTVGYASYDPIAIVKIMVPTLFPTNTEMEYGIVDDEGQIVYGCKNEKVMRDMDTLKRKFDLSNSSYLFSDRLYGQTEPIPNTNWNLLFAIPSLFAGIGWPFLLLLGVLLISLSSLLLSFHHTAEVLYQPIKQVVLEQAQDGKEGLLDEFAIIQENGRQMQKLSKELDDAMNAQIALKAREEALSFLGGIFDARYQNDQNTYYVACIDLDDVQASSPILPFKIEAEARTDSSLTFVRYSNTLIAIILQEGQKDVAVQKIRSLIGPSQLQAAVSSPVVGKNAISKAFIQARWILEYRHMHPSYQLLFPEDVDTLDENSYYYPLSLEKQFLQAMELGTGQVEVIIMEIKEENLVIRHLSGPARQNLTYAVAGTICRALQDLKSTTLELYGVPTDWASLYASAKDRDTLETLFSIAGDITKAMKERGTTNDAKMLSLMRHYIEKHYNQDIMLQDMADQFNITAKYCGKVFSQLSNDTFKNYLNEYRVNVAKERIKDNPQIKINDLANAVGFNSATSFIRVFNRYVGLSPKTFADNQVKKE